MPLPSFLSWFSRKPASDPLPLQTRVHQMEVEMLEVRILCDRTLTIVKRLSGKVYKGIPLGDTVDAVEREGNGDAVPNTPGFPDSLLSDEKQELYRRAAQLRGRR